jgi:hypothetical protein
LETVGESLHHSSRTIISGQGISLHYDGQSYRRRLLGLITEDFASIFSFSSTGQMSVSLLLLSNLQRLVFLLNSCSPLFSASFLSDPLLPKLRGHFAEFLHDSSPTRLGTLMPAYQCRFPLRCSFRYLFSCISSIVLISHLLPSSSLFRFPRLRDRITPHYLTLCGNPAAYGESYFFKIFSLLIPALSLLISPVNLSIHLLQSKQRYATPSFLKVAASVWFLSPVHFRCLFASS